ncbi:MAG: phospholipid-binding protein MlaC [Candidatus Binatia bacterium]
MKRRAEAKRTRARVTYGMWLITLLVPCGSSAAQSPQMIIRNAVDQAVAVLENPAYQGDAQFNARIEKVKDIVFPHIDASEFARRCLGAQWQKLNETQRQQFIDLFTTLVEKSYGGMLDRYPKGVRFTYDQERIDGRYAQVDTRIQFPNQDKQVVVSYSLHQKDGTWLIYDVAVENISMVRNYRNQFQRILNRSSFEDLVAAIRRKIQQLESPPTS